MSTEWHFLVTLNERISPLRDPLQIQDVALRLIGDHLQASRVNYSHVEGTELVVRRSYVRNVGPSPNRRPVASLGTSIIDACRRGEAVVVSDVRSDPRLTDAERAEWLSSETAAFVAVPLIKENQWIAVFAIHNGKPHAWTRDQIQLIEVAAERVWVADARAHAEKALGEVGDRRAFLRTLTETIRPLTDPARILAETCRMLGTHLRVNRVAYGEIDGDYCTMIGEYVDGLPSQTRTRWTDLGGSRAETILKGGTVFVNDTSTDPHTAEEREALQAAGIGAYICPLLVKDGRFVAAFGIHNRAPRLWTADEVALAQDVADRIWATLEHRRAEAELRANEERLKFLLRLNDALRPLSDAGEVQETAARLLCQHLGATRVGYAEFDGGDYKIVREYVHGVAPLAGHSPGIVLSEEMRAALRRGETVVVNDVQTDPRLSDDHRATMKGRQIAAFVGTVLFKGGRMVAAFGANNVRPRVWTASEIALVQDVAQRTWDAVERARAEAALREQKLRLGLALEASAGGSWTWNAATNHVDWDPRFRALYGFAPDDPATPDAWIPRIHEEDRPRMFELLDQITTSTTMDSWESTFRIVRPDGTTLWIQSRGRAERDADGKLTRLSGLDLDFSHHHQTEEARQARRDEEHDRALRTLLETATQGIVSVDDNGTIATANHAFEAMFRWPAGELIGQPINRLMPSVFRGRRRRGGLHLVGICRDGSTFPIEVSLNHVATPSGGRAFAFVTDITDRQRAASALQERTAELERRTTQLSRMASDLTLAEQRERERIAKTLHDGLQQLLVITALSLEQLKRDADGGAAASELIDEAKRQLDEAIAAARSLNFELFPPVLQRAGLPAALKWLADWTHDKYKVDVHVAADPRADSGRKDVRTLLFESVRELLFNAVKHARAERIFLELSLDDDDQLLITVTDQGIGFEPAELDERSEAGEVGWGLFSIRERLTLLGGRVEIHSAPGKGTEVRLVAPRGSAQTTTSGAETSTLGAIETARPSGNGRAAPDALKILIVDDHAGVRSALRDILQQRPQLSVVGDASNGLEAIAHAHALQPDVILMDITMPQMDGIEATTRIRADLPDIQILGLSMQPRNAATDAIEQAGAAAFFVKGTDTQRLIDHLLGMHTLRPGKATNSAI
jgi:PAS domain S-box-containing protein